jgi:hypothetical protein
MNVMTDMIAPVFFQYLTSGSKLAKGLSSIVVEFS